MIGVFFYSNRAKLIIDLRAGLFCAILIYISFGKPWFNYIFPLAFSYLIFCLAYQTYHLNIDKKFGDLSYGIYIYAWPIQQSVAQIFPTLGPAGNTIVSTLLVTGIAYLSWHYIEKPALSLKNKVLNNNSLSYFSKYFKSIRTVTLWFKKALS